MTVYVVLYHNYFENNPLIIGCFSSVEKANRALEAHWMTVQPNVKLEYYQVKEFDIDTIKGLIV